MRSFGALEYIQGNASYSIAYNTFSTIFVRVFERIPKAQMRLTCFKKFA